MTDEQVCIWKLVREIVVNPKYPVSREYGNVDACFFRTDCGIDINRQIGTREMHKNWLNGTKCSHCHRPDSPRASQTRGAALLFQSFGINRA